MEEEFGDVCISLEFGFYSGLPTSIPSTIISPNHSSTLKSPTFITSDILSELAAGRYAGPYTQSDLESRIGFFRTSPIGLVDKGPDSFRKIHDLSYLPVNDPSQLSVNNYVNPKDFPTEWGDFNNASEIVLNAPPGSMAATFDVKGAYRNCPIFPSEQNWLVVGWEDLFYVDRAVCFGFGPSAGLWGRVADVIAAIARKVGMGPLIKWVDDFFLVRPPGSTYTEDDFIRLSAYWGVPWEPSKTRPFSFIQRYIGFDWDLQHRSVEFPHDKKLLLLALIISWIEKGSSFTLQEAESLHGKLVHSSSVVPLSRPFLPSITSFIQGFKINSRKRHPSPHLIADLKWIHHLYSSAPPRLYLTSAEPYDLDWWGDASTSWGVGVSVGRYFALWKWAPGFEPGPKKEGFDIGWAEAVAVELGFALVLALRSSGKLRLPERTGILLLRSDNMGVVAVVNKGRSRGFRTNESLKSLYTSLTEHSFRLHTIHVPTASNITDSLSRGDELEFRATHPGSEKIFFPLPRHLLSFLVAV